MNNPTTRNQTKPPFKARKAIIANLCSDILNKRLVSQSTAYERIELDQTKHPWLTRDMINSKIRRMENSTEAADNLCTDLVNVDNELSCW